MALPLVFNAICRAAGGELSDDDNREYLTFEATAASGTGDAVPNGGPIKIIVQDQTQQGLFTVGNTYTVSIS